MWNVPLDVLYCLIVAALFLAPFARAAGKSTTDSVKRFVARLVVNSISLVANGGPKLPHSTEPLGSPLLLRPQ